MRKLFIPIIAFLTLTAIVSVTASCDQTTDESTSSDTLDTAVIHHTQSDSVTTVEGVVIDGAKSSVTIVTEKNDTLDFEYEYLSSDKRYHCEEGDTIDVTYYTANDSVVLVAKKGE